MSLDTLLGQLAANDAKLKSSELVALHGIKGHDRDRFLDTWRVLSIERRRHVVDSLSDIIEDNTELDFSNVFMVGLFDDDVQVRADSIKALWEYEGQELVPVLIKLLDDPEALVRAEAALGLGRYLMRAELDGEESARTGEIERALRALIHDAAEIAEVRGRALEALGARSHEWVRDLIEEAYGGGERAMQISAVHAMGRSADPDWLPTILEEMHSDDAEMRFEAATAAGAIAEEDVVEALEPLTRDEDAEVQEAAIAALGQVGGPAARNILHELASGSSDERVLEAVTEALAEADFLEDPLGIRVALERSIAEEMEDEDEE